jgi:hypothetical protein
MIQMQIIYDYYLLHFDHSHLLKHFVVAVAVVVVLEH